jgi:prephenate dehydrogenase
MSAPAPRVAIIGLGLMGGSLARDLAARSIPVLGFDRRPGVADEAVRQGVIERSLGPDLDGVEQADLIVLATPVDVATDTIPRIAGLARPSSIVTDVGSTKRGILSAAAGAGLGGRFVGSHPLAGDQRSGWTAARSGLYEGATVFVCPSPESSAAALEKVLDLWRSVGARPREIGAAEHDRVMSTVSHLPQVASSALAIVLSEAGFSTADLGPGGRDMTRLADSSPDMWTAIAASNSDNLLASLGALEDVLARLRHLLEKGDREGLREFFESARRLRG